MELSPRQRQVLEFIERFQDMCGYPPTLREIGKELGIRSTNAVSDHLNALERKGMIVRDRARSRGIAPPDRGRGPAGEGGRVLEVPLVGRIAAGVPLLAEENVEGTVRVDSRFAASSARLFALRVVGDSMVGDGILDGDVLVVKAQETAPQGAIVVALVDSEATVKRLYREGGRLRLQPSNPAMPAIIVEGETGKQALVQGVVVGVMRVIGDS